MATFVQFNDYKTNGVIDVNVADPNVAYFTDVPSSVVTASGTHVAGTFIHYDSGLKIAVRGTMASVVTAFAGGGIAPSKAIYVDTAGNDSTGQRGSPVFPFLTMAAALAVAQSGDEILVSPGTYTGAFSLPAIANLIIRGSGSFAGDTILTAANATDVCTMNAANRSILFDNIQLAGATTGRAVVGTGATAARAWLSSGLIFQNCILSSAAGNSLDLTYAGALALRDVSITAGNISLLVCSGVNLLNTQAASSAITYSWDETDALRPTAGQGELRISSGSLTGAVTLASNASLLGGAPKLNVSAGSEIGALTGSNLGDNAAAHLSIIVNGKVGAVDFQSAAAKQLPDTATALVLDFQGAILTASGAGAFAAKVGGAAANAQTIHAEGLISKTASTFISDVKVTTRLVGASLTTPTYSTPGGTGDFTPPVTTLVAQNIAAGGALAFNIIGGARVTTGFGVALSAKVQASDAVVSARSTTQITITSTAQGGNTADAVIVWP